MGRLLLCFAAAAAFNAAAFLAFQAGEAALGVALVFLGVLVPLYCAKRTALNGLDDLEFVFSLKRGRAPGSYLRGRNLAVVCLAPSKLTQRTRTNSSGGSSERLNMKPCTTPSTS